jgi:hypothetical protein
MLVKSVTVLTVEQTHQLWTGSSGLFAFADITAIVINLESIFTKHCTLHFWT